VAGRISNRLGSGTTLTLGSLVLGGSLGILLIAKVWTVWMGLLGLCTGFFTVHAGAIGLLNRRLSGGQGRANALYVLFYYMGGWLGITASGLVYGRLGWRGVVFLGWVMLTLPLAIGLIELSQYRGRRG
jgi:MFS transporter, YNFM family, putative membrane transport protein